MEGLDYSLTGILIRVIWFGVGFIIAKNHYNKENTY